MTNKSSPFLACAWHVEAGAERASVFVDSWPIDGRTDSAMNKLIVHSSLGDYILTWDGDSDHFPAHIVSLGGEDLAAAVGGGIEYRVFDMAATTSGMVSTILANLEAESIDFAEACESLEGVMRIREAHTAHGEAGFWGAMEKTNDPAGLFADRAATIKTRIDPMLEDFLSAMWPAIREALMAEAIHHA
jgi:hypothetical protein